MKIDNRYYFRLTPARYQSLPCPDSFLLKRPLVKTEGTEETPTVYYTAADGLTIEQAINLYYTQNGSGRITVQYYDESGAAPVVVDDIANADRVLFSLWGVYGSELRDFINTVESLGENPDEVIIPSGKALDDYLTSNKLPS